MLKQILATAMLLLATEASALNGLYSAPVPTELKAYATSPVIEVKWTVGANHRVTLAFKVPDDLTGSDVVSLEFREVGRSSPGFVELSGAQGRASCLTSQTSVVCLIKYSRVSPNPQDVAEHLNEKYGDETMREGKKRVADRFMREPAGVLEFDL